MLTKLKLWWHRNNLASSYNTLEYLESTQCFISPFFCGKTMYPIKLQERLRRIKEVKAEIIVTKDTIVRLEEEL